MSCEQAVLNAQFKAAVEAQITERSKRDPSVLMRPGLFFDGNRWCALYGANMQDGVAGFGDSPAAAMNDFDRHWRASIAKASNV